MSKERFACQKCPAFYECCKPHMKATAGGWKSERIDGKNVRLYVSLVKTGTAARRCASMPITAWLLPGAR